MSEKSYDIEISKCKINNLKYILCNEFNVAQKYCCVAMLCRADVWWLYLQSLDISIIYEVYDDLESPDYDYTPKPSLGVVSQQSGSLGSYSSNTSGSVKVSYV